MISTERAENKGFRASSDYLLFLLRNMNLKADKNAPSKVSDFWGAHHLSMTVIYHHFLPNDIPDF